MSHRTVDDIINANLTFGPLDREQVKQAMGPNWPEAWEKHAPTGMFTSDEGSQAVVATETRKPQKS